MGLFNWLGSEPSQVAEADRVWLTNTAKLAGLAAEAAGGPALILAHFPRTLHEIQETLTRLGFAGECIEGTLATADCRKRLAESGPNRPIFALASQLQPTPPPVTPSQDRILLFVAERHFLRFHDERILEFAATLGPATRVVFFISLDEPLMKNFAGEWVGGMLKRLGMEESDAIESAMVLRRIKAAQTKFGKRARSDGTAKSAEEWLERYG